MRKRIVCIMAVALSAVLCLGACGGSEEKKSPDEWKAGVSADLPGGGSQAEKDDGEIPSDSREIFAMDTYMTVTCYGERCEEALEAALNEIQRLDDLLSVGNADSEVSYVNQNGHGTVSKDTAAMIAKALEVYQNTGGAFDMTVYPIMELWGFTDGNFAVPDEEALRGLLEYVGSDRVAFDSQAGTIELADGQGIDLGGIAKGFTSDRLMEIFEQYDLVAGLVSLGGNVQCYGRKPDGTKWKCGIQDPLHADDGGSYLGVLQVDDQAVITSGAYERNFIGADGKVYHHIIDPADGYPANSGIISATIVSGNGMLADALSTSCYIMGLDGATDYWRTYGDDFEMILMDEDEQVYITQGLVEDFSSDYEIHVIDR